MALSGLFKLGAKALKGIGKTSTKVGRVAVKKSKAIKKPLSKDKINVVRRRQGRVKSTVKTTGRKAKKVAKPVAKTAVYGALLGDAISGLVSNQKQKTQSGPSVEGTLPDLPGAGGKGGVSTSNGYRGNKRPRNWGTASYGPTINTRASSGYHHPKRRRGGGKRCMKICF